MKVKHIFALFTHPHDFCYTFICLFPGLIKSDKKYIRYIWKHRMNYPLNLDKPSKYNEKLQWMKLYDRNPLYTIMVDKYEAKKYVANIIGDEYIIPTLGVWDTVKEIDWDALPNQFVLKCTHDSGGLVICKDKKKLNRRKAERKLKKSLRRDFYKYAREWPYKNVPHRIIAETYMEDDRTKELRDYKFFCFNGEVKALFIATDRQNREEPYFDFFDSEFNHLDLRHGHPNAPAPPEKPLLFDLMKKLAARLSTGYPQMRVDFYEVNGRVYFGELTLFHHTGMVCFEPAEWDDVFGSWIDLNLIKNKQV